MHIQCQQAANKVRLIRINSEYKLYKKEDTENKKTNEEEEIDEAKLRLVYDSENKVIILINRRPTDCTNNRNIHIAKARTDMEEA